MWESGGIRLNGHFFQAVIRSRVKIKLRRERERERKRERERENVNLVLHRWLCYRQAFH